MLTSKHQHLQAEPCPVARAVDVIADRWTLLVVRDAFDGKRRFGDFQRGLGIARSMLTDRLRNLVAAGIFEVKPASDGTSYQEYVLTSKGSQLFPLIVAFRQWGERHLFDEGEAYSQLLETASGEPLELMSPTTVNGRTIRPEETTVRKVR